MRFLATPSRGPLVVVVVGPLPLLAEGRGCSSPPLLAGVRWLWWWVIPRHSWLRAVVAVFRHSWLRSVSCGGGWSLATPGCGPWLWFPATPGWGPLVVVVDGPSPLLAEGPGGSSPPFLAGACLWRWCGGVVRVCWSVVLWLVVPPLLRGPSMCVCALCVASCWCGLFVGFVPAGLAVCVCVCVCGVWCQVCGF